MSKPTQRPTPEGFTLPPYKHEYVAYQEAPYRTGNAETGEADEMRASVFVREIPSIKVRTIEHKQSTSRGETFAYAHVTFDAESMGTEGFRNDFGANVQAGGPVLALLEQAKERGAPVYVALETVRKARTSDQQTIDHAAYIHDLRGAARDGSKGNVGDTGRNCKNLVAGVGVAGDPSTVVFAGDMRSDPAEWASLRKNRDHTLPPAGWKVSQGGIVRATSGSGSGDPANIDAIADAVAERMSSLNSGRVAASENKPWEPLNSDGRVNLASHVVAKTRYTYIEATRLLTEHTTPASDPQHFIADTWLATDLLLWMADEVQAAVTGKRPNRSEGSHKEAAQWCRTAYATLSGTPAGEGLTFPESGVSDTARARQWADRVVAVAAGLFSRAATSTEQYLTGATPATVQSPGSGQAPADPPAPQPQATSPEDGPAAGDAETVAAWESLLATVGQAEHPERFTPLLTETFGAGMLAQIGSAALRQQITTWSQDPPAFSQAAYDAWQRAATATAPAGAA